MHEERRERLHEHPDLAVGLQRGLRLQLARDGHDLDERDDARLPLGVAVEERALVQIDPAGERGEGGVPARVLLRCRTIESFAAPHPARVSTLSALSCRVWSVGSRAVTCAEWSSCARGRTTSTRPTAGGVRRSVMRSKSSGNSTPSTTSFWTRRLGQIFPPSGRLPASSSPTTPPPNSSSWPAPGSARSSTFCPPASCRASRSRRAGRGPACDSGSATRPLTASSG